MTSRQSILLVEDNAITAMALEMEFQQLGHEVHLAATGPAAIELARRHDIRLCVMDVRLAGKMDGFDAARQIITVSEARLIFVTGYDDRQSRARAAEFPDALYLVKPANARDILRLLTGAAGQA